MDRRTFLATAALGGTAATAGCGGVLGGSVSLRPADSSVDRTKKHLSFRHDGRRRAVLSIQQMGPQRSPTDTFELRFHISHHEDESGNEYPDSTVERFQFDLRTPQSSVDPPADVYLKSVGSAGWPARIERTENGWSRITADDVSEFGAGTITVSTLIRPVGEPATEVALRAEIEVSNGGFGSTTYELAADTRFEPVVDG
jgi:hypothetical protein